MLKGGEGQYVEENTLQILNPKIQEPNVYYTGQVMDVIQTNYYMFQKACNCFAERCKIEKETRLVVCTEEYTSKTCTRCGSLNDVGSSEVYQCSNCDLIIDRDVNGARNIFIKCVNEMM